MIFGVVWSSLRSSRLGWPIFGLSHGKVRPGEEHSGWLVKLTRPGSSSRVIYSSSCVWHSLQGNPYVDLFTNKANTQIYANLPVLFWIPWPFKDIALSTRHLTVYAYTPFALLIQVLFKSQVLLQPLHDPSCFTLATKRLVCRSFGSSGGSSFLSPMPWNLLVPAPCEKVSQRAGVAQSSRLETVKWLIRKVGFSEEVAEVTSSLRKSAACIYQEKWTLFIHWCRGRNIASCKATLQQLAEFFQYLQKELKLSLSCWRDVGW